MTGLRAEARFLAALGLAAGLSGWVAPAVAAPVLLAQAGPPIRLVPPPSAQQPGAPPAAESPAVPAVPAPEIPAPATATPAAPLEVAPGPTSAIEISQPPPVSMDAVGLADPQKVGLPDKLWDGSSRALIERLIGGLPDANVSRPARDLIRRLLTVAATPPAGAGLDKQRSFLDLRAGKLLAMGDVEDAVALARLVPSRDIDETLAHVQLDAMLAAYDNAGACALVHNVIARFSTPYWQRTLIFCQLLSNEHDRAQLGLSILQEQQAPDDAAFDRLVARLSGDKRASVDKLPDPAPLHLAMMRAANMNLPADLAASSAPLILRMVAASPNAPVELRVAAAERAEAFGALPSETLGQIYDAVEFKPEQLADALAFAQNDKGPKGRAILHRAAKIQPVGAGRAELLQRAWRLARERGGYATAVRVDLPALLEIAPDQDLVFFAADAARALLFAGKLPEAHRWYELVRLQAASGNDLAATTEAQLSPLFWLADADERKANTPPLDTRFEAWSKAQEKLDAAALPARAAVLVTLLTSTGDSPDPALLAPLLTSAPARDSVKMPAMGLWLGLGAAFEAGRIGETALFSLAILGPDGGAGAAPQTTQLVLDALRAAALDTDARALAVETAIAEGL